MGGAKSQILFNTAVTPAYSQYLGKSRSGNASGGKERSSQRCFTTLNMTMNLGGIIGTLCSAWIVAVSGTPWGLLTALPGIAVVVAIAMNGPRLRAPWPKQEPRDGAERGFQPHETTYANQPADLTRVFSQPSSSRIQDEAP